MSLNILQYVKLMFATKQDVSQGLEDKLDTSTFNTHSNNSTIHITSAERTDWNSKATGVHNHTSANITDLSGLLDDKVDKVDGKGLSDNNFTTGCKNVVTNANNVIPSTASSDNPLMDEEGVDSAIASAIGGITSFEYAIVDEKPEPSEAVKGTIYLVLDSSYTTGTRYKMYLLINDTVRNIGSTDLVLSDYATVDYVNTGLDSKQNIKDLTKSVEGEGEGIDENSDDEHYVTPKAVYEFVNGLDGSEHEY